MLPACYDINFWNNFCQSGKNSDGNTYTDSSGNPYAIVVPDPGGNANWGWLSLDDSHVGSSTMKDWVNNGMASGDVQALQSASLLPLSKHPANTWDWNGENGKQEDVSHTINSYIGKSFLLPLYQPYNSDPNNYQAGTGKANQYYYDIVAFVSVTIVDSGNQNQVAVEPSYYIDPSTVFSGATILDTSSQGSTTSTTMPSKLTQ
jgi:hypothetical protein